MTLPALRVRVGSRPMLRRNPLVPPSSPTYTRALSVAFAPELDRSFFPLLSSSSQLLRVMSIFALGLGMHPVGALIFGEIGDNGYLSALNLRFPSINSPSSCPPHPPPSPSKRQAERKLNRTRALLLSFLTAIAPTLAMCLMPSYSVAGEASQWMLVGARVLQGVSVGGQSPGCHVLAVSTCRPPHRGLRGSLCHSATAMGFVLASIVVATVRWSDERDEWEGRWRVPFWFSLLFMLPMTAWLWKMSEVRETERECLSET